MKTAYQIYMNFVQANNVVSELRKIARDTRAAADDELGQAIADVDRSWDGENSQKFLRKARALKSNAKAIAKDIDKIADTVERIAKNTYDAEMKAVRIAQTRGSGGGGGDSW